MILIIFSVNLSCGDIVTEMNRTDNASDIYTPGLRLIFLFNSMSNMRNIRVSVGSANKTFCVSVNLGSLFIVL